MTLKELKIMQSYPLEVKIAKTQARIHEWVRYWGEDNVYISFSGGKDSTVLLNLVRELYPNIQAVFCDTGLEYPEIKEFVNTFDNVEIIRPSKSFKNVLIEYGYPVVSKTVSKYIREIRNTTSDSLRELRLHGNQNGSFKLAKKWRYLLDAPFKISDKCCYHLKKSPFDKYSTRTGKHAFIGNLAEEGSLRKNTYLKHGCNNYDGSYPTSQPLSFWKNTDVLQYIVENKIRIAPVYGRIKKVRNYKYYIDGLHRTGCIFCPFGAHCDAEPNRYETLKETHPDLYSYCINGGEVNSKTGLWQPSAQGLGFNKVLDYIGVKY